jgi:hypothetical protein
MILKKQIYKKIQFNRSKRNIDSKIFFVNCDDGSNWLNKKEAICKKEALSLDVNIRENNLKNILHFLGWQSWTTEIKFGTMTKVKSNGPFSQIGMEREAK